MGDPRTLTTMVPVDPFLLPQTEPLALTRGQEQPTEEQELAMNQELTIDQDPYMDQEPLLLQLVVLEDQDLAEDSVVDANTAQHRLGGQSNMVEDIGTHSVCTN